MENLTKLVHIDLKGAPLKLSYLKEIIPFLKTYGMAGLLLEYEDMFPYGGYISFLSREDAYSKKELLDFLNFCGEQGLIVIPLVQTFGHMEFALKHERLRHLRENFNYPMTICPSLEDSVNLIKEMINQVLNIHSDTKYLHIGADSVLELRVCNACQGNHLDVQKSFLQHIINIAGFVKKTKNVQPIIWDDMLREIDPTLIKNINLNSYIEPMIWNYDPLLDITDKYLNDMLSNFTRLWVASAYKGADGAQQQIVNTSIYVKNNQSWCSKIRSLSKENSGKFVGIALTGWSRFDHFASLCELFPASIPSLVLCLEIINYGAFTAEIHDRVSKELGFPETIPWEPLIKPVDPSCVLSFPGQDIFQGLNGWYILSCECNDLLNSDTINGWMSKYHRDRLVGNTEKIEKLLESINKLYICFKDWKDIFQTSFQNIFLDSSTEEWFQCNVMYPMEKLHKRICKANELLALGDCVFDRSDLQSGDN